MRRGSGQQRPAHGWPAMRDVRNSRKCRRVRQPIGHTVPYLAPVSQQATGSLRQEVIVRERGNRALVIVF